jgi:hypothetical protein
VNDRNGPDRRWVAAVCGVLLVVSVVLLMRHWGSPPQIGADGDVMKTVDALFTAMTTRDLARLDDCDRRLKSYHTAGRLPARPAQALAAMIQQARDGQWEPAAKRLYEFIYGQWGI